MFGTNNEKKKAFASVQFTLNNLQGWEKRKAQQAAKEHSQRHAFGMAQRLNLTTNQCDINRKKTKNKQHPTPQTQTPKYPNKIHRKMRNRPHEKSIWRSELLFFLKYAYD